MKSRSALSFVAGQSVCPGPVIDDPVEHFRATFVRSLVGLRERPAGPEVVD